MVEIIKGKGVISTEFLKFNDITMKIASDNGRPN